MTIGVLAGTLIHEPHTTPSRTTVQPACRSLAATRADTEIVGPPQAVNVSVTEKADEIPGSTTDIELTTGQVCSPSVGKSLDCTRNPTPATPLGGNVNKVGSTEKADSCPVVCTVVGSDAGVAPCTAPIKLTSGRPSSEQAEVDVLTTSTGLKIDPAAPKLFVATSFN
jgi:hypothetical protein